MNITPFLTYGELESPLRNIRCTIDDLCGTFDLIPEELGERGSQVDLSEENETLRRLLADSSPILEGAKLLRLEFDYLLGVAVDTDIDVDLYGGLHADWDQAPRLKNGKAYYPLLEIAPSPWKAQLPDYRGRDTPNIKHFRMISLTCSFDVLGILKSGTWLPNTPTIASSVSK